MNAVLDPVTRLRPMFAGDLEGVMAIETRAYSFPWTRGNFIDSLAAGYLAELLIDAQDTLLGYFVAMPGVDEMHLLNLTVAPPWQGRGHASTLLDALERHCQVLELPALWLEVRAGNQHAREVYLHRGFVQAGVRRAYYPAGHGAREDAIVMSKLLRGVLHGVD